VVHVVDVEVTGWLGVEVVELAGLMEVVELVEWLIKVEGRGGKP
jgi:hypothetical protein